MFSLSLQAQTVVQPSLDWTDATPVAVLQTDEYLYVFLQTPSSAAAERIKNELVNAASQPGYTDVFKHFLEQKASEINSFFAVQAFKKAISVSPLGLGQFLEQEAVLYAYNSTKYFDPAGPPGKVVKEDVFEISGRRKRPSSTQVAPITAAALDDQILVLLSDGVLSLPKDRWLPGKRIEPAFTPDGKMAYMHLAVGDFNGDGTSEVAVALADPELSTDGKVLIYKKETTTGATVWAPWREVSDTGGVAPVFLLKANMDNDGSDDLIIVNGGTKSEIREVDGKTVRVDVLDVRVKVILTKYGEFETVTIRVDPESKQPRSAAAVDLDGDGFNDLVIACPDKLLFVSGRHILDAQKKPEKPVVASTVLDPQFPNSAQFPARLLVSDVNNDGYNDLLAAIPSSGKVWVYWGSRVGPGEEVVKTKGTPVDVLVSDLTGLGFRDLLVLDQDSRCLNVFVARESTESGGKITEFADGGPLLLLGHGAIFGTVSAGLIAAPHAGILMIEDKDKAPIRPQVQLTKEGNIILVEKSILNNLVYFYAQRDSKKANVVVALGQAQCGLAVKKGEAFDGSVAMVQIPSGKPPAVPQVQVTDPAWCTFEFLTLEGGKRKEFPDVIVIDSARKISVYSNPWPAGATPSKQATAENNLRLPAGKIWQRIHFVDLNKDGLPDYVAITFDGEVYVGQAKGVGDFNAPAFLAVGVQQIVESRLADLDGDGLLDLVLIDIRNDEIIILWGENTTRRFGPNPTRIRVEKGGLPTAVASARWSDTGLLAIANYGSASLSLVAITEKREWEKLSIELGKGNRPIMVAASNSLDWLIGKANDQIPDFVIACYSPACLKLIQIDQINPLTARIIDVSAESLQGKVINAIGKEIAFDENLGTGITGISTVDLNGDGLDDVFVSLMFPRKNLEIAEQCQNKYTTQVTELLKQQWQEIVIFLSSNQPTPPRGEQTLDVAFSSCSQGPLVAILSNDVKDGAKQVSLYKIDLTNWTWSAVKTYPVDQSAEKVLLSDVNNDGSCDIVVSCSFANKVQVYWGPDYELLPKEFEATPGTDTVMAGAGWILAGNFLYLMRSGGYWSKSLLTAGTALGKVLEAAEVTGAGPPHLVVHQVLDGAEALLLYSLDTERGPELRKKWEFPEEQVGAFAGGDFDGDSKPDTVVFLKNLKLWKILFGNGRIEVLNIAPVTGETRVAVGDLNGDSLQDCVIVTEHGRSDILLGMGGGLFSLRRENLPFPAGKNFRVILCDFDKDRKSELIVTGLALKRVQICPSSKASNKDENINGLFVTVRLCSW
jgi:hypothetical protein